MALVYPARILMRWNPKWASGRRPKGQRWEQRRRAPQGVPDNVPGNSDQRRESPEDLPDLVRPKDEERDKQATSKLELWRQEMRARARSLWGTPDEYRDSLEREKQEAPELWLTTTMLFDAETSRYRKELKSERLIVANNAKKEKQVRDTVSVLRRRRSQLIMPFSTLARSVSYFNQRVPTRVWRDQQRGLRIGAVVPWVVRNHRLRPL